MSFSLKAITPLGVVFNKEVSEAYFPGYNGPIGIFTDYANGYFCLSEAGVMKVKEGNEYSYYAIFGGVVKVENNSVIVLSDDIEDGFSIDMARAVASRDRANDRLLKREHNLDEKRALQSLQRAATRINVYTLTSGGK